MRLSATRQAEHLAPKLPNPFPTWERAGLALRKGKVSIIAAAPGVGKSLLGANYALRSGARTMYFSADTHQHDVLIRAIGIVTGQPMEKVDENLSDETHGAAWAGYYEQYLKDHSNVDWVFDTDLNLNRVVARIQAHVEMWGDFPEHIFIDNLGNTVQESVEETSEEVDAVKNFQKLARDIGCHITILHHLVGAFEDGDRRPPLGALKNKLGAHPEQVFTLWRVDPMTLGLYVAKNRGGKSQFEIRMDVDYNTAKVGALA